MSKILTNKQLLSSDLIKLSNHITAADRAAFMAIKKASKSKLSCYLNGKVYDEDVALDMIRFFKKRIEKRNKAILELVK
jgi:hypothetical protein